MTNNNKNTDTVKPKNKKASTAFFTSYLISVMLVGAILGVLLVAFDPAKSDVQDRFLVLFTFTFLAVPFSAFLAWPAILLGLLMTISLHRRNIDRWWIWVIAGGFVGLLTSFGLGFTGMVRIYGLVGLLCSFLTWRSLYR